MRDKHVKIERSETNDKGLMDTIKRLGVGVLYASTDLGQNDIAQIMGMGDKRVNALLKGIKKPSKRK